MAWWRAWCLPAVVCCSVWLCSSPSVQAAEPPQFNRDIRPILSNHCFPCHGPDSAARKGGFRLDRRDDALANADSGQPVLVPGNPGASPLLQRVRATEAAEVMPPPEIKKPLSAKQIDLLERWIAAGAPYERHWSLISVQRPAVPAVSQPAWVRNEIDAFVLARLEREGLPASPEAGPETLIRRLALDLTGLPPTPAEVEAFVAEILAAQQTDRATTANSRSQTEAVYRRWVDYFLDSPHYGERMAVDWLDAARFADTNGYQVDRDREMWAWRDWVIQAFNSNQSFAQFTIEQIAGDLLPNATPSQKIATGFHRNHMLNEEGGVIPDEFLAEYCADRVETTAALWLGQTFNCARCHDHKYDAFTQRDFYGMYAFYHNVAEGGIGNYGASIRRNAPPFLKLPAPELEAKLAKLRMDLATAQPQLKDLDAKLQAEQPQWEEQLQKTLAAGAPANTPPTAPVPEDILALLKKPAAERNEADRQKLSAYQQSTHPERKALAERIAGLTKQIDETDLQIPTTLVMEELPQPRVTRVLMRGDYTRPGDEVTANTPASLPPLAADLPRNRLGLARWLVDPANPLPARVTVNRFWQSIFGTGLVRTSEDFGTQGEPPSHPELLDWLADEFVRSGWDVKHVLRLMVTSSTYRQSSRARRDLLERDPDNRLLARGPRFRLQAEFLRDQALAASGLLVKTVGGPSVKPYHPPGLYEQVTAGSTTNTYVAGTGDELHRRSMYTYWKRSVPHPAMLVFDAPFRESCSVRRSRTNTPLQALNLLNDPTYVEAARFLAARMLTEVGPTLDTQLTQGYRLVLARAPQPRELAVLRAAYQRALTEFQADANAATELLQVGIRRTGTELNPARWGAMTVVASTILNLDETVMKE
ncbi:MAG: PSD1 domain-containing protein [Planctomycetes bacterium]|nr:PSD1 domain-containing protein [Planctomycetota bacterium]